jgi:hypothetical protein
MQDWLFCLQIILGIIGKFVALSIIPAVFVMLGLRSHYKHVHKGIF